MHGHEFLTLYESRFQKSFSKSSTLVEIGADRDFGSSLVLAKMAKRLGWNFIAVDMDPEIIEKVTVYLEKIDPNFKAVAMKGEDFLKSYKQPIHVIYLDAFDTWHPRHNEKRIERYKTVLNTTINDTECWKMHYDCAIELCRIMRQGAYICFDDVYSGPPEWDGKGKTAIPLLENGGFELVKMIKGSAIFKRERVENPFKKKEKNEIIVATNSVDDHN